MKQSLLACACLSLLGCNLITGADDISLVDRAAEFDDVEAAVVVLEGDALRSALATSYVFDASAFARIGLLWDAEEAGAFEVSTSVDLSSWSEWSVPRVHHIELEEGAAFAGQFELSEPNAHYWRLRDIPGIDVSFVRVELLTRDQSQSIESGETTSEYSLSIGPAEVHTRAEWSAKGASCSSSIGDVYRMAIHHTETPTNDSMSPEARLRQIQSYHQDVKGWCDIGYHYLMSRDGRLWEGRPANKLGAHAGGANTGNLGVSVMGAHDATPITESQLVNVAGLVRGLADVHGVPLDWQSIKGHREYKSTTCPGDALFGQLGDIVDSAADGGGSAPPPNGGSCGPGTTKDGPWSCSGLTGTTTNAAGKYYTTSFGCWVDENGVPHTDGGDNCIPACSLASIGCSGMTGPECERDINWYTAGSDRYGCGTRLRVTNPDNGKSAVLMVIDRGPNCSIENIVDHWVLDMSYRASHYLFGGPTSASEKADVQIQVVPASTPLGPATGDPCANNGGSGTVTLKGYLYEGSNTSNRIAGATVALSGGGSTTTSSTGYWEFPGVAAGSVDITGSKTGYQTRTITRSTSGTETWASFGLSLAAQATGTAVLQGVIYHTTNSLNRIPYATVSLSTGQTITADGNGYYKLYDLPAGSVTVTASKSGWTTESVNRALIDGETEWGSVRLYQ